MQSRPSRETQTGHHRHRAPTTGRLTVLLLVVVIVLAAGSRSPADDTLIIPRDNIVDAAGGLTFPDRSRLARRMQDLEQMFDLRIGVAFLGYLPASEEQRVARTLTREMLPEDRPGLLAVHVMGSAEVSWHVRPAPWAEVLNPQQWNTVQSEVAAALAATAELGPVDQMLSALAMMGSELSAELGTSRLRSGAGEITLPLPPSARDRSPEPEQSPARTPDFWSSWLLPAMLLAVIAVLVAIAVVFYRSLLSTAVTVPETEQADEPVPALRFPQVSVGLRLGAPFGGGVIGLSGTGPESSPASTADNSPTRASSEESEA